MKNKILIGILALLFGASLVACGGGGDSDNDDDDGAAALIPPLSSDLAGWDFGVESGTGAKASVVGASGSAKVSVVNGGTASYDVQLVTTEPITLTKGHMYELSYTVKGTAGSTFYGHFREAGVDVNGDGYKYSAVARNHTLCDGTAQTVTRKFKVSTIDGPLGLSFEFGSGGSNGTDNSGAIYQVSSVLLEDLGTAPELTAPELVLNGDFANESLNWQAYHMVNEAITSNVSFTDKMVKAEITDSGSLWWHIAVQSTDWITLTAGKSYTLKFTCSGEAGKSLRVAVQEEGMDGDNDGYNFSSYISATVAFDGTTQTESIDFTPPVTNKYMTVKFGLGYDELEGINNDNGTVTIDDVSLKPTP